MAKESVDRFSEWYQQNRYIIERGLGGFYLLQREVYVECGLLCEEIVGNCVIKIESKIYEDYSDGTRRYSVNILASLENRSSKPQIVCCDEKRLMIGDNFGVPGYECFNLFRLNGVYRGGRGMLIGPKVLELPKD